MNSSSSFLKNLATKCFDTFGNMADELTIVFPNKRAGLFFRKHLASITSEPIWSPKILSIEEFVMMFSEKQAGDQNRLLFALYSVYKSKIKKAESFDNFYHWGEMILNDFNDIDNYLIDSEHIFRIIKSQKELDDAFYYLPEEDKKTIQSFWAGFLPKPTKSQSDFLRTWEILNTLYQEFNELLAQKSISYKGKIYREVAESIETHANLIGSGSLWFAGFNAFTKTEEKIIKYLVDSKKAEIFWDIDSYYLDDEIQESGYFFRQYIRDHSFENSIKRDLNQSITSGTKEISVHSVALSIGQVKTVGEKLQELSLQKDFSPEDIVIILPDENLLLPMLNSIPESIDQVNVTMGYPIKNSNFFTFFESLLELLTSSVNGTGHQYFKSNKVLSLLNHPIYNQVFNGPASDFVQDIISTNKTLLHSTDIQKKLPKLYGILKKEHEVNGLLIALTELFQNLAEDDLTTLDKAVVYELYNVLTSIRQSTEEFGLPIDIKILLRLFSKLGGTKVPFSGEPLSGLQIMGTLETRNLDFRHVFVLDMNEGIWPKDSSNNSFVPYNIRKAFDLPVVEHQDAIQAYLFYRLLHRANSVDIYYNNVSEFNHSGELSRYVQQIQMESGLDIDKYSLTNVIEPKSIKPIIIFKDEKVNKALSRYHVNAESGGVRLSPSALNTFLDCRLKFYFKYLEKIKEKEELNESLDAASFGNLLHHTMEYFYEQLMKDNARNSIEKTDFDNSDVTLEAAIQKAFMKENRALNADLAHNGQQLIASKVIKKFAIQIINYDKMYAPFEIHALEAGHEDGYALDLPIQIGDQMLSIGLKGIIDRIDKKEGVVRILDYKSGGDERNFPSLESLFDRDVNKRNKAAMQVLLYCLFYKENNPNSNEVLLPGVFNSKDLFSKDFDVKIKQGRNNIINDFSMIEAEYTEQLKARLEDMFDPETVFDQTDDLKKCDYCAYSEICMRG